MEQFSMEDKKRIVLRQILTDEVKNFNSLLFTINGSEDLYQRAFHAVYDELFGRVPNIETLSSVDLRRISFALRFVAEALRDKLISNAQHFNDYSNYLNSDLIVKIAQRATAQSGLLFRLKDSSKHNDIKKIIKDYSKSYKLNTTLAKEEFYLQSNRKSTYYAVKNRYVNNLRNFLATLERLEIEDKRDIDDILKTLNNSFFKLSNKAFEIEPINFILNKTDKYLCADYLRINALKFEYANDLLKYLPRSSFQDVTEIIINHGEYIRDLVENKLGKCPEDTAGFYNAYLSVMNNKNELSK